jgi:hypothetical protein
MRLISDILSIFLFATSIEGFAQGYLNQPEFHHYTCPEHKTGCYLNYKDFNDDHPVMTSGFELKRKYTHEKKESKSGGYLLDFNEKEIKPASDTRKKIKVARIWGVYYNDSLYINREVYLGKKGFDKVSCLGSLGYFHSINPNSNAGYENDVFNSALFFGLVGGIVADAADEYNENRYGRYPKIMIYLLDYETGMISPLSSFKLEKILEDDPQLYDLYQKEEHKFSMMTMHYYIDAYAERHKNEIINK